MTLQQNYVIATIKPWHEALAEQLRASTAAAVYLVRSPEELTLENLRAWKPRYVFFPHWSHRISQAIWSEFECVIFHMTDVPYGRGGSPLQNLIVRGHSETMISALQCVAEMDAGPVYLKRPMSLEGSARQIYARSRDIIREMILHLVDTEAAPKPQEGPLTVFARRRPEEGEIGSLRSAKEIYDHIRMLDAEGYPPAFVLTDALRINFQNASLSDDVVTANVEIRLKEPSGEE